MESEYPLRELLERLPKLEVCREEIYRVFQEWIACFQDGGKLMICGNGGSQADSLHIVGELMKSFERKRALDSVFSDRLERLFPGDNLPGRLQTPLRALALGTNPVLTTAISNDVSPEMIFAQEVYGYGECGDVLFALSTCGNSVNVLNAVKVAKAMGIRCIGMCGGTGGELKRLCDLCIVIPEEETYLIQEAMLPVYHSLCRMVEGYCFPEGRAEKRDEE